MPLTGPQKGLRKAPKAGAHSGSRRTGRTGRKTMAPAFLKRREMRPRPSTPQAEGVEGTVNERGKKGEPLSLGDTMHVFRTNIEQIFGGEPSYDGAPLATGDLASAGLTDGTMYLGLQKYQEGFGDVYKLCFGPKSFMVVSDPQILKHILRENVFNYDKGVLGEVLEDVMGKGLIPADFETWRVRRRAIVPGFHQKWLNFQVSEFGRAGQLLVKSLRTAAAAGKAVDMEERFGSVALDIIGKSVFNYEFGSVEGESPVVKAAIQSLREVEHRAQTPLQYWKFPLMDLLVERQREFTENMKLLNDALNKCISQALADRSEADLEELENRDYTKMENPSLLRFLVDMRGETTSGKQLRDDMITMLIAGHETTASALTWALFELAQNPELLARLQKEVDSVMGVEGHECPTYEDIKSMELLRLTMAESLRMYPEPPLLIRRALDEDTLPAGATGNETKVLRGMDFFAGHSEFLADMSEKEKRAYFENLRQEKEESEASIRRAYQEGRPKVVINCSFGEFMSKQDNKSLALQVKLAYAWLKESKAQVQLHLTSLTSGNPVMQHLEAVGMKGWKMHMHQESIWDLFPPEDLVVLSPDADAELETVEEGKIYVIGGLVDRRPQRGRTLQQASQREGEVELRKLPVKRFAPKGCHPIMNVDVVVKILTERLRGLFRLPKAAMAAFLRLAFLAPGLAFAFASAPAEVVPALRAEAAALIRRFQEAKALEDPLYRQLQELANGSAEGEHAGITEEKEIDAEEEEIDLS
ncbi:unnamed protein product [Effrenium voratum]|nr:unnamed protein product [Effrenium voratum]